MNRSLSYIYINIELCKYQYVYSDLLIHICIYMYISQKKWWQSGSTEKYSVEALSAGPPLSRAVVA